MDFYPPINWAQHRLHAAAFSADVGEVERLIAKGADVNEHLSMDLNGEQDVAGTPLHVALRNCTSDVPGFARGSEHLGVVKLLLEAGADPGARRFWEGTPLHDAARRGLVHIAKLLICHGADVNSREEYEGLTPLHLAAAHDRLEMVEFLIREKADIDAVAQFKPQGRAGGARRLSRFNAHGMTALHLAAREGHVAVVKKLVEAGAALEIAKAIELAADSKRGTGEKFDNIIAFLRHNE